MSLVIFITNVVSIKIRNNITSSGDIIIIISRGLEYVEIGQFRLSKSQSGAFLIHGYSPGL